MWRRVGRRPVARCPDPTSEVGGVTGKAPRVKGTHGGTSFTGGACTIDSVEFLEMEKIMCRITENG